MPSEARLKFLEKIIILGPKTAILGPQFCRTLVLGPHFWWPGGPRPLGPPWICPWDITTIPKGLSETLFGRFQQTISCDYVCEILDYSTDSN